MVRAMSCPSSRTGAAVNATDVGVEWAGVVSAQIIPSPAMAEARGSSDADETAILEWANARLAKHQRINRVVFLKEFPRNALGKEVKRMLRDEVCARMLRLTVIFL